MTEVGGSFFVPIEMRAVGQPSSANPPHPYLRFSLAAPGGKKWLSGLAIVDTGMSISSFDEALFLELGCWKVGEHVIASMSGEMNLARHHAVLRLGDTALTLEGPFSTLTSPMVEPAVRGIIGMDVLHVGTLLLQPPGKPSGLTFHMPGVKGQRAD